MSSWEIDKENDELVIADGKGGSLRVPNWSTIGKKYFEDADMSEIIVMIRRKPHSYGAVPVRH